MTPESTGSGTSRLGGLLMWLAGLVAPGPAWADDAPAADDPQEDTAEDTDGSEDSLQRYRTPFPVLTERVLGTASRPIEFDWRRTRVHLGAAGSELFELNNFDSLRAGGVVRIPSNNLLYEVGVGWVFVQDTVGSELLALTPYRQPGRPRRVALDFNIGIPLAEGVVTTAPRWFPAVELVFSGYAGLRYAWYPGAGEDLRFRDRVSAAVNPRVTKPERQNLDAARPDAMRVDPGRYTPMVGFGNDIYFRQGIFVNPRASLAVPVLAPISNTSLRWWGEFTLCVGVAL